MRYSHGKTCREIGKMKPSIYPDYLQLNQILSSQSLISEMEGCPEHDELLFIIMHQTYELWFKEILHELDSILIIFQKGKNDEMETLIHRLKRIKIIIELLLKQFEVIETMTPLKFLNFRSHLGTMSGFQSAQFRLIEIKWGLKREERLLYNQCPFDIQLKKEQQEEIHQAEKGDSLFSYFQTWLESIPYLKSPDFHFLDLYRKSFEKMEAQHPTFSSYGKEDHQESSELTDQFFLLFNKDKYEELLKNGERHLSHRAFQAALFLTLYSYHPLLTPLYRLVSAVDDLNFQLTQWRYRHSLMVQKMIGWKKGTGGSSGVAYLRSTVEKHNVFSDLSYIPMVLLPEAYVPPLPKNLIPSFDLFFKTP